MEDRYLFKGKIKAENTGHEELDWAIGNLVVEQSTGRHYIVDLSYFGDDTKIQDVLIEVEPSTICQCTGLRDKNSKLIWENDIVNCIEAECCGRIVWNESEAGFYFDVLLEDETYEEECIYDYVDCMDVIGNVFDNPELLEVQE